MTVETNMKPTQKIPRIAFVHDHVFRYAPDGAVYSPGAFSTDVWERYLSFSDRLSIIARGQDVATGELDKKLQEVSHQQVDFTRVPNLMTPKAYFTQRNKVRAALSTQLTQVDAVICRLPSELGLMAVDICREMAKPYFVEVAGDVWDALWHRGTLLGRLYTPFQTIRVKRSIRHAPFVIYVTRNALQQRYPTDGVTTYASNVVLPPPPPKVLEDRLKRQKVTTGPIRLGLIGPPQLRYKGLHLIAPSLRKLRDEGIDFKLHLLGQGEPESVAAFLADIGISDFTQYDGTLPAGPAVYKWLDDIDIYIQPSLQEGLPRATIEALSRACVVVGSDVAGLPELLAPNCVFNRRRPKEFADRIRPFLTEKETWAAEAKRNFETAQNYTIPAIAARREIIYAKFAQVAITQRSQT